MSLTRDQQRRILKSCLLEERLMSIDRYSFYFNNKLIVVQLSHTGNGYAFGKELNNNEYKIDSRGWINIKNFTESELQQLITKAKLQSKFK